MRRTLSTLALVPALCFTLTACPDRGTTGASGNLSFVDETPTVGNRESRVDRPLAVGAELEIRAREAVYPYLPVTVTSAVSSDPSVIEVLGIEGGRIRLAGRAPGATVLDVTSMGSADSLPLKAADIATSVVHVNGDPDFDRVLLPGTEVRLFPLHQDAEGRDLTGYGVTSWSLAAARATLEPDDVGDGATLTAGPAPEVATATVSTGVSKQVEIVSGNSVAEIAPVAGADNARLESVTVEVGAVQHVFIGAWTADGRYVLGETGDVEVIVPPADAALVGINRDPNDPEREIAVSDGGRFFVLVGGAVGETTATVRWLGHETTLQVTVEPAPPPEDQE